MLERMDETIVAISSAPGRGPVGIVRLGGPRAFAIAGALVRTHAGKHLASLGGFFRVAVEVRPEEGASLPGWCYLFRSPHSYTRQDMVEIYTVGSPVFLEMIRQATIRNGARDALHGEFSARAFLNGAMDLAQAEAVAGIIHARSDAQLRAARMMLDGRFGQELSAVRDQLAELLALVEADIDFAEEPIEFITPLQLRERIRTIADQLRRMADTGRSAERLDDLPRILLLGPPNAGKSSLMNALSGTNRAICAAVAGTTRDILSVPIALPHGEAILLDSAGVDRSDDEIFTAARAMTLETAGAVDLVCAVIDVTQAADEHFAAVLRTLDVPALVIAMNKCDLLPTFPPCQGGIQGGSVKKFISGKMLRESSAPVCAVSALKETGLDSLREAFARALGMAETTTSGEAILFTDRQRTAIVEATESLARATDLAQNAAETIDCADLVAFELRETLEILATVTGETTTEELLGRVFARFCIGK